MGAESLQAACELAFVVAREDSESDYPVESPASMRSFLYVSELPRRAITVAQQAIEDDSDFRGRVAARATEDEVGRAGYLWLHRPKGWAQEFEMLTADPDDDSDLEPAEPDHDLEAVYNGLVADPVELVKAQPPEPQEPDYSFDPGETFSPASPPIADAPMADAPMADAAMATAGQISGFEDMQPEPPPSSYELPSLGTAAVTDQANYEIPVDPDFDSFDEGDGNPMGSATSELDFEADALESELSSLRGLVNRLAGERETVVTSDVEEPAEPPVKVPTVGGRALETEILALESDLETARHELAMAQADLATARHEREEAQRLHSDTLKRQVDLEKELTAVREQRVEVENQASEAQVSAISLEDKLSRSQAQLEEAERERKVVKSQLEIMTSERNQIREDHIAIKAERDELHARVAEVEEKSRGVDVGELYSSNKSLTSELEATSRELARMIAQAESFEEQIKTSTSTADALKTAKIELTSRLADTELALETTSTQHEALKVDSERLAAEVGTLRAERDGLQSQLTELQASLADVLSEQAETRHRHDADRRTLNELRVERDVLLARMNDLEQTDREYETKISSLVQERDDLVVARDDLINERGQLRGEAAAAASEKDQLLEKLRNVESRIGPLETELQAERRQREELANRLLELDDIADQNAAELARLNEERDLMSAQLEELQAERVAAAETRRENEQLIAHLLDTQSRLEEEAAGADQRLAELTEQLDSEQTTKGELEQRLAEVTEEMDARRLEQEENSREVARLRVSEGNAAASLAEVDRELEILRQEYAESTAELTKLRATEHEARSALAKAEAAIEANRADLEATVAELDASRSEVENTRSELDANRVELDLKRSEIDSTRADLDRVMLDVEAKQDEIEAGRAELQVKQDEIEAGRAELQVKQDEIEAGRAELQAKQDEIQVKQDEIEAGRAELQAKQDEIQAKQDEIDALAAAHATKGLIGAPLPAFESDDDGKQADDTSDRDATAEVSLEPLSDPSIEIAADDSVGIDPTPATPWNGGTKADRSAGTEDTEDAKRTEDTDDTDETEGTEGVQDTEDTDDSTEDTDDSTETEQPFKVRDEESGNGKSAKPILGGRFDWPPPALGEDETAELGAGIEAELAAEAALAGDAGSGDRAPVVGGADEDEDDLDEVSELIAKTVSGFNDVDVPPPTDIDLDTDLAELAGLTADESADLSLLEEKPDRPGSILGITVATDETTYAAPKLAPAPPSIFGTPIDGEEDDRPKNTISFPGSARSDKVDTSDSAAGASTSRKRRQIEIPDDILEDEVAMAQFVVSSPDVVLLVDGDSVAQLGWPSLPVAQQRDALVTYLADLSTSSGAAPDVVFDGRIGDDQSLPASRAVRIRLSTPPTEPAAALDELVDAYPEQWPIALVTDDADLAASAGDRGAAVLNNGQLLDLFIAE